MSRCGKKGGIPKKFHREKKKEAGINVPKGVAAYGAWIRNAWSGLGPAGKAPYLLKRGNNKNSKGEACVRKSKPKRPTNTSLPSNAWIKKRAPGSLNAWKLFKKGRKGKAEPSKKIVLEWMTANGLSAEVIACYELRRKGYVCSAKGKQFNNSLVTRLNFLVKPKGVGPKLNLKHKGNAIIPQAIAAFLPNTDWITTAFRNQTKNPTKNEILRDAKQAWDEIQKDYADAVIGDAEKQRRIDIISSLFNKHGISRAEWEAYYGNFIF